MTGGSCYNISGGGGFQVCWTGLSSSTTGISISSNQTGISVQSAGGNETRPINAAVNFLIKY
jgi:hypothetical protein